MIRTRLVMPFYPGDEAAQLSANFTAGEFRSNRAADHDQPWFVAPLLVERLQMMRDLLGQPLVINSGFRTWIGNAQAQGKRDSRHLIGYAADIDLDGTVKASRLMAAAHACGFRRIGVARGFVHVDIDAQPSPATWTYDGSTPPTIHDIAADAAAMFPGINHPAL